MNNRQKLAFLIILLLVGVLIVGIYRGNIHLYTANTDINKYETWSAVSTSDFLASDFANRVGILVQNPYTQEKIKSRQADYLKAYLMASGYPEVYILQSDEYEGQPVDLFLILDLNIGLSRLPIYKKGTYSSTIRTLSLHYGPEDLHNEKMKLEYREQGNISLLGIISQAKAYDIVIEATMRNFVASLNKLINQKLSTNYDENIESVHIDRKVTSLDNQVSDQLHNQYTTLIPDNHEQLFIYHDQIMGERSVITFASTDRVDELLAFYQDALDSQVKFLNYAGGRKIYEDWQMEQKLMILIKHLEQTKPWQSSVELERKTVTIFQWDRSDNIQTIQAFNAYDPDIFDLEQMAANAHTKDFYYYYGLMNIKFRQLQYYYWKERVLNDELFNEVLKLADQLQNYPQYPGASRYYKAQMYANVGTMLRSDSYLVQAVQLYTNLVQEYGDSYFGYGAANRLMEIMANPIYSEHDYNYVLARLSEKSHEGMQLTKADILYCMGRYEAAFEESNKSATSLYDGQLHLFIMDKIGKIVSDQDYPENIPDKTVADIRWTLTHAFFLKRDGSLLQAKQELAALKARNPEWWIYHEADALSLRIGFEYDLVEFLSL